MSSPLPWTGLYIWLFKGLTEVQVLSNYLVWFMLFFTYPFLYWDFHIKLMLQIYSLESFFLVHCLNTGGEQLLPQISQHFVIFLIQVLGPNMLCWLCPISRNIGNGVRFRTSYDIPLSTSPMWCTPYKGTLMLDSIC